MDTGGDVTELVQTSNTMFTLEYIIADDHHKENIHTFDALTGRLEEIVNERVVYIWDQSKERLRETIVEMNLPENTFTTRDNGEMVLSLPKIDELWQLRGIVERIHNTLWEFTSDYFELVDVSRVIL